MPRYEITAPDGGRYEITAPEGATEAQILSYAQQQFSASQPQQKQQTSALSQTTSGINEGLLNVMDVVARPIQSAFMDAPQYLAAKAMGAEPPEYEEKSALRQMIEPQVVSQIPPQNTGQEILRSGGELVGESLPVAAGLIGKSAQVVSNPQFQKSTTSAMKRSMQEMAEVLGRKPVAALAGEAGAAMTAGMAGQIVADAGGNRQVGELVGGILPASMVRTATDTVKGAYKVGKSVLPSSIQGRQDKEAAEEVANILSDSLDGTSSIRLKKSDQLRAEMGDNFKPSLAQSTQSPALRNQQQTLERRLSGGDLEEKIADYRRSESAVNRYITEQAPQGVPEPVYVVNAAQNRLDSATAKIQREKSNVQTQQERFADGLPRLDRAIEGQRQRNIIDSAKEVKRNEMSALADELGLNQADGIFNNQAFKQRIKANAAIIDPSEFADNKNMPSAVYDILNAKKPKTFQDIKTLRERVTDDVIDAQRSTTGSRKKVRALMALKKEIDDFIEESYGNSGLSQNYQKFRERYLTDYVQPFEQGAALKAKGKDASGTYRLIDEEAASAFWEPGNLSAARQYKKIFGKEAQENIRPVVYDSLRDFAVRDGVIDPRRLNEWQRKYGSVLEEFPDIKKGVGNAHQIAQGLLKRNVQIEARTRTIEDSALNKSLKRLRNIGANEQNVIDSAVGDPRLMHQIIRATAKDQSAMNSLRRNVWEKVASADSKTIASYLEDNKKSLLQLYPQTHLYNLRKIQAAKEMLEFVPAPKGMAEETNLRNRLKQDYGLNTSQISAGIVNVKRGRSSKYVEGANMLSGFFTGRSQKQMDALFETALYDPEVAKRLVQMQAAKSPKESAFQKSKRYLDHRLFKMGFGVALRETTGSEKREQNTNQEQ